MIDKDYVPNVDEDAREYFNKSPLAGPDYSTLFNTTFYEYMMINDSRNKYREFDAEHWNVLTEIWYRIFGLSEDNVTLDEMKKFIEYGLEYMDFIGKEDKLIDINKRIKNLNKDFQ